MAQEQQRLRPADAAENPLATGAAWVEGEVVPVREARIPLMDMGFVRSDATYDVAHVWKGAFFRLNDHVDRFLRSVDRLRLKLPFDRAGLIRTLADLTLKTGLQDVYVAMIATRGIPKPGTRDPRTADNRFYAFAVPFIYLISKEKHAQGINLHLSERIRIPPESVDPTVKNYHWLDLEMGLFDAYDRGADTVVLVDAKGNITEGPGFNLFAILDGKLITPDRGTLEGVTRRTALEIAKRVLNIPIVQGEIPAKRLHQAAEIFLTSTAGGILPVTRLDGRPVSGGSIGPVTKRFEEAYWAWHADPEFSTPVNQLI